MAELGDTGSSLAARMVKGLPEMQETHVQSLGWEDHWRRDWLPTPMLWPGEVLGQLELSLISCSLHSHYKQCGPKAIR